MSEKPGFMIYFADWMPLLKMDDTSLAALFRAVVNYGATGEVPSFTGMNAILWEMIVPKVDRDEERYQETCRKARFSRYKGIEKQHGREGLSYEEWCEQIDERQRTSTNVTNSNNNPTSIAIPITTQPQDQSQQQAQLQSHVQGQGDARGVPIVEDGTGPAFILPSEVQSLFQSWKDAIAGGRMKEAFDRSSELFRMGYDVDLHTGDISKR